MPTAHVEPLDPDWVFVAYFRCARCGRHVTLLQHDGDPPEGRSYRHTRLCATCITPRR